MFVWVLAKKNLLRVIGAGLYNSQAECGNYTSKAVHRSDSDPCHHHAVVVYFTIVE